MSDFADKLTGMSRERLALMARELHSRLAESEDRHHEPIAVIGLSCRFPGAPSPAAFWQLLQRGDDAITEIPGERWNKAEFFDPNPDTPGKMYVWQGGFIEDVDQFDPQFFGIAPREAVSMDPQQRLMLEVVWEALENSGQAPSRLVGSETGVYIGISTNDYMQLGAGGGAVEEIDAYTGTGAAASIAAGRLSYILGLFGPNFPVDTACSSSLVALHLACQNLRSGDCRTAIVGGVNLILAPQTSVYFCKVRALSPDGRCKTFDAAADGYVRSEGCGVVVLKRLSEAQADGDRILAVIRGSAVNHDGRSSGLTVPNGASQEALLRRALANAQLTPADVSYVEAHGTGTPLGDPIEIQALGAALGQGHSAQNPLLVGSVKTNIGHLEAAAGVAGLIKVILALQHRQIPAHLHFQQPNPYIAWNELPLEIPGELRDWQPVNGKRVAGVSSFGFSGTNAHVVLEEAPTETVRAAQYERPLHLLCLSAKSEAALKQLASQGGAKAEG